MSAENPRTEAERLGQAIQIRRAELKMKRPQLARQAELSYPYVSEIENGMKVPSSKALNQIAQALGLSSSELMLRAESLEEPTTDDSSDAMFMTGPEALFDTGPQQQVLGRHPPRAWIEATARAPRGVPATTTHGERRLEDLITAIVRAELRAELNNFARVDLPALVEAEVDRLLEERGFPKS